MRIALIAPPFIPLPPPGYGGTELFVTQLALGLKQSGHDTVVYTTGDSTVAVEKRFLYPKSDWPIQGEIFDSIREINHTAWAVRDAARDCDVLHLNSASGLALQRFIQQPMVYTIHHTLEKDLVEFYRMVPEVNYVSISEFQRQQHGLKNSRTIHHGIDLSKYALQENKQDYLLFLGRIAPVKGTHIAIQVAKAAGIPLKIAGQIQPSYKEYWETQVKPHVDGKFIEFVGEADLEQKNRLLGGARAMLFPIQWNEPFGLVLVESMACGTPVLAFPGGSVAEIVREGVSGHLCGSVEDMAARAKSLQMQSRGVRRYAEERFSLDRMVQAYCKLYAELLQNTEGRRKTNAVPGGAVA